MIKIDGQLKKTLTDGATNAAITFLFRRPTTAEQLAFDRKSAKGRLKSASLRVRKLAGEMIKPLISAISFPDIDSALAWEKDGKYVPLSSNPSDPGYREDWLAVVDAFSPNMLRLLGLKIFAGENEDEDGDPEALETAPN